MAAMALSITDGDFREFFCHRGHRIGLGEIFLRSDRSSRSAPDPKSPTVKPRNGDDTGAALRSVYQTTVKEPIPPEMLDLLRKLD